MRRTNVDQNWGISRDLRRLNPLLRGVLMI